MLVKNIFVLILCFVSESICSIFEWKQLDFVFPNDAERQKAIRENRFNATNCFPLDADVQYQAFGSRRVFVTVPRFNEGVPVTLGTVSNNNSPNGPLIQPYPNYDWHKSYGTNCDGITSVFRVMIDECNRLWVLDTGKIGPTRKCEPQILAFDLFTDTLLHRYRIPRNQLKNDNLFVTPVVDVLDPFPGGCLNTMVYMADPVGYTMVVLDMAQKKSWQIINPIFNHDPNFARFTVAGESFDFKDGLLGMAIQKRNPFNLLSNNQNDRKMFFHSFAAATENAVPLSVLNDGNAFKNNPNAKADQFRMLGNRGIQTAAEAIDSNGNLFFGLMDPIAIACWDSSTPYKKENIRLAAESPETLQFASGMKVISNIGGVEELWVMSNRLQKALAGTVNWNEVNFRIQAMPINQLLGGQKCGGFLNGAFNYPLFSYLITY